MRIVRAKQDVSSRWMPRSRSTLVASRAYAEPARKFGHHKGRPGATNTMVLSRSRTPLSSGMTECMNLIPPGPIQYIPILVECCNVISANRAVLFSFLCRSQLSFTTSIVDVNDSSKVTRCRRWVGSGGVHPTRSGTTINKEPCDYTLQCPLSRFLFRR